MKRREILASLGALGLPSAFALALAQEKKEEEGFVPLFNGKDLASFIPFPSGRRPSKDMASPRRHDCLLRRPHGYLRTEREFSNFILRFEYRMMEPETAACF